MKVENPAGCGNAPRVGIVNELVAWWAAGDAASLEKWLAPDRFTWVINGSEATPAAAGLASALPREIPERLEIRSTITHGRFAACEGTLHSGTSATDFCHVIVFTGAGKTAKIAGIRTFSAEVPDP